MTQSLVIRPLSKNLYPLEWYLPDAGVVEKHILEDAGENEPTAKENTCLLVSPARLVFRELTLPAGQKKITQKLIGWLAEETTTGDGESFHWTVIAQEDNQLHVVGMEKNLLLQYLASAQAAGFNVTAVKPDGHNLPWHEASWTAQKQGEYWLVRNARYQLCELDERWFRQLLISHAPGIIYCDTPVPVASTETEVRPMPVDAQQPHFEINMLHGEFIAKPMTKPAPLWLRKTAIGCCIGALACVLLVKGIIFWQLSSQTSDLKMAMQNRYQQFFPQEKRHNNFKFYFDQQVKHYRPDALTQLKRIEDYLTPLPDIQINLFDYRQQDSALKLQVTSADYQQVAQLAEPLQLQVSPNPQSEGSYSISGEMK